MSEMIHCVASVGDICGEGAVWHPEGNTLYWTDINRFLVHRLESDGESIRTWVFSEPVTSVNLTTETTQLLLVLGSRIGLWSPHTHPRVETLFALPTAPLMRFNDAGVDSRGSLWVGTMRNNVGPNGEDVRVEFDGGVLYRVDPNKAVTVWKNGIGISNTLAWSPDRKTFYFGDSVANAIYQFNYDDETGAISNEQPFLAGYERGVPDGSTIDSEGFLWNTRASAGCLARIAPDGSVDQILPLPVSIPTSCTFGGNDLGTLYITSARSEERLSGSVFAIRTGIRGVPTQRFLIL